MRHNQFHPNAASYIFCQEAPTSIRMPMLWKCFGKCDDGGTYTPVLTFQGWCPLASLNDLPGSTVITIPACSLAFHVSYKVRATQAVGTYGACRSK